MTERKTIRVDYLTRVEGEGALHLELEGDRVADLRLEIYEPPRFFEAFLRGRSYTEAPDVTARICGICPVAYQMSAVRAMEDALGVEIPDPVRDLRRLLYCGEWIESHVLHVYMLHAPDFLGYPGAVEMARDHGDVVRRGLRMKKAGNAIVRAVGGREIHPINVRVGGFYSAPSRTDLGALRDELAWARDAAVETVRWVAGFPFPDLERDYELVALRSERDDEYPMGEGRVVSTRGLDVGEDELEEHLIEEPVPHSNALHARLRDGGSYLVGPLARFALNADRLAPAARELATEVGCRPGERNPFRMIVVRSLEVLHAFEEAIRLVEAYRPPDPPAVAVEPHASAGAGCTEAPRGMLYHRYELEADGTIRSARIVPPTSQNQRSIEEDLLALVPGQLDRGDAELTHRCEQAIRNHDPCISCATHFLRLDVRRRPPVA